MALVAWRSARQTAKRVDQLTQMVWALRYQHGELRIQVERSQPPQNPDTGAAAPQAGQGGRMPDGFVSLSSLKQK